MVIAASGALISQGMVAGAAELPPGCIARDPGESTCEFTTDGWIEAEWIHALGNSRFQIDIYAPDGSWRNSAGGGGGVGPLDSVWIPAEPGDRVVATVRNGALAVHGD